MATTTADIHNFIPSSFPSCQTIPPPLEIENVSLNRSRLLFLVNELTIRLYTLLFSTPEYQSLRLATIGKQSGEDPSSDWIPEIFEKVLCFIEGIISVSQISSNTVIYAFCLMFKAIAQISQKQQGQPILIIDESNLGSFLLAAVILSNKQLEDEPFTNKCWARVFEVDVRVLNAAEIVFLLHLDFSPTTSPEDIAYIKGHLARIH
ncbi:hypothetical protein BLNAU_10883 [Blattamonas nauphoetae]|uniref:Cyclin N-terminal domain-containing protein n=1 Tax=Blattamonas nauphoetae TaxID=2049346 RepID=A0ABQ9XRS2_9EUKA|nr:hypothetical protein BLNAU_10883 [Blattamonas nauphoetae]